MLSHQCGCVVVFQHDEEHPVCSQVTGGTNHKMEHLDDSITYLAQSQI